ncbi:MAG: serine/threonine protein kinase [Halioglobus sp.]|nr:serine/threonine protein kinase [Halioglobus sp.]
MASTVYDHVGPYRILRHLKEGGQGNVFLGYDARLHRKVAIKIYRLPASRAGRRQLRKEARLIADIQSPRVVAIHDVIESDEHLALVMEYVAGCTLEDFLSVTHPSLYTVLSVCRDVAGALAQARQRRIVHGDVKPANILLTMEGRAKLTDFGIARKRSGGAPVLLDAGSYSALSPEQYRGEALDGRSDLFAMGCLLYRMLSGRHPFVENGVLNVQALLEKPHVPVREAAPGFVEIPDALAELVDALLQKKPADRPRTTRLVRYVLRGGIRKLPLAHANNLVREMGPSFRPEDPGDMPVRVPPGLAESGVSRLPPRAGVLPKLRHYWQGLRRPARAALVSLVAAVIASPFALVAATRVTPVQFAPPHLELSGDIRLPRELSGPWLLDEFKTALREEIGQVHVIGEVGADPQTTVYSPNATPEWPTVPDEVFSVSLSCDATLCVLDLHRAAQDERRSAQGLLLSGMSSERWRDTVRARVKDLYR